MAEGLARGCSLSEQGSSLPPTSGLQDELRAQTSALGRQLVDMEAERDSATSRARQLQKAVAQSEEGESSPHPWVLALFSHVLGSGGGML